MTRFPLLLYDNHTTLKNSHFKLALDLLNKRMFNLTKKLFFSMGCPYDKEVLALAAAAVAAAN